MNPYDPMQASDEYEADNIGGLSVVAAYVSGITFAFLFLLFVFSCLLPACHGQEPRPRLVGVSHTYDNSDWRSTREPVTVSAGITQTGEDGPRRQQLQRNEDGTFWKFTPEQVYHAAAVRVSSGSAGGSGTLVGTSGEYTLMVTNHHVVEQGGVPARSVKIYMRDGTELTGQYLQATPVQDVAVYAIRRNDLPCVAVCSENAPAGAVIDTMGFGGPWHHKTAFRPYYAKTVVTTKALAVDAPAISGDSGSGMIWRGTLVGVNWGADATPHQSAGVSGGQAIPLVYPATSSADATFLNRYLTQSCGPLGCSPIIGRPGYLIPRGDQKWERQPQGNGQFPGPEQFYRPDSGGGLPQTTPPSGGLTPPVDSQPINLNPPANSPNCPPSGNCQPGCGCDLDGLAEQIAELIAMGCERGEKGERGEQGPAGPAGEITQAQLDSIVAAVVSELATDPRLKGADGKDAVIDAATIDRIKGEVLASIPDRRFVIRDAAGNIVEDETYAPGEAIVLDVQSILNRVGN